MDETRPVRLALGGLLAMAAALGIGRFVYTPILPEMMAGLGWSASAAGLVASANYLGYLLGALATAGGSGAGDLRLWLLAALAASGATTLAMAVQDAVWLACLLRFLGGAASAYVIVCASTLVLQRLAGRSFLSTLHFAGVGVGMALSAAGIAGLDAAGFGWRAWWLGAGLLSLLATPFVAWAVTAERPVAAATAPAAGPPPRSGALTLLTAAYGLFGVGYVVTATFLVAIVRGDAATRSLEPWIWLVVGLAGMPSVGLWSAAGRRLGVTTAYALASALLAVGVAASTEWRSTAGAFVAAVLLGATIMGLTALGLTAARQLSGGRPRQALGRMTAAFALGQMIGPVVAGLLADRLGGYRAPSLGAALAMLVSAGLALWAGSLSRRAGTPSTSRPGAS